MLSVLRSAKVIAASITTYPMDYIVSIREEDDLGDVIDEGDDLPKLTVMGKIIFKSARLSPDGSGSPEGFEVHIAKTCNFEPCPGARVIPKCGPFAGICFTVATPNGSDIRIDSTGAFFKMKAYRGKTSG